MINKPQKTTKLIRISGDQIQLLAGGVYKVGARYFEPSTALSLSRLVSGVGGMDAAVAASTLYYVYVVNNGGSPALIASTSESSPAGYTAYRKVGAFYTDTSANIFKVHIFLSTVNKTVGAWVETNLTFQHTTDEPWISSVSLSTSTFTVSILAGVFSLPPFATATWARTDTQGFVRINSVSTSQLVTQAFNDAGANTSALMFVAIRKNGVDAAQPDWNHY